MGAYNKHKHSLNETTDMFKAKTHQKTLTHSWLHRLDQDVPEKRVVRSSGATEKYTRSTLARSIHQACVDATGYLGEAEVTALRVCHEVESWLEAKYEVTSGDIQRKAVAALRKYNPEAAYAYAPAEDTKVTRDSYGFVRL